LINQELISEIPFGNSPEEKIRLHYIYKSENDGGSGGYYEGIKRAYKDNFDWIWIMDDDSEPTKDCLEKLFNATIGNNLSFVGPLVYGTHKSSFEYYHNKRITNQYFRFHEDNANNWLEAETKEYPSKLYFPINACGFVGPLVNVKIGRKTGLPRKDFFILLDDTEFTYRLSKHAPGLLVKDAIIRHKDIVDFEENGMLNIKNYWKMYYWARNRLLFLKANNGIIPVITMSIIYFSGYTFRHFIFRYHKESLGLLLLRYKGIIDAVLGKSGKRIIPGKVTI